MGGYEKLHGKKASGRKGYSSMIKEVVKVSF